MKCKQCRAKGYIWASGGGRTVCAGCHGTGDAGQLSMFDGVLPRIERRRVKDIAATTLKEEMEVWAKRCERKKQRRAEWAKKLKR